MAILAYIEIEENDVRKSSKQAAAYAAALALFSSDAEESHIADQSAF